MAKVVIYDSTVQHVQRYSSLHENHDVRLWFHDLGAKRDNVHRGLVDRLGNLGFKEENIQFDSEMIVSPVNPRAEDNWFVKPPESDAYFVGNLLGNYGEIMKKLPKKKSFVSVTDKPSVNAVKSQGYSVLRERPEDVVRRLSRRFWIF